MCVFWYVRRRTMRHAHQCHQSMTQRLGYKFVQGYQSSLTSSSFFVFVVYPKRIFYCLHFHICIILYIYFWQKGTFPIILTIELYLQQTSFLGYLSFACHVNTWPMECRVHATLGQRSVYVLIVCNIFFIIRGERMKL